MTEIRELAHSEEYIDDSRVEWWDSAFLTWVLEQNSIVVPKAICDIGCGAGHWAINLAQALKTRPSYTGVDNDPYWIDIINKSAKLKELFSGVVSVISDASDIELADESFDLVTCQTLLMHLSCPERAILEMNRICAPGGSVIICEPCNVINRSQLFEAIQILSPRAGAALMETWSSYHAARAQGLGVNYDIAISIPEILSKIGIEDFWVYFNPKVSIIREAAQSNLLSEYNEKNREIAAAAGLSDASWREAFAAAESIIASRPQRMSCVPSGLFMFGFKKQSNI